MARDFKDTGHPLALHDTAVGVGCNRRNIVGEEHAIVLGGPRQKRLIRNTRQSSILGSDDIKIAFCAEERAENVVIQIFVGQPPQYDYECRLANNRARIPSAGHRDSLDTLVSTAKLLRFARYAVS